MKIPSGSTDRYAYFVAVDATDLKTRETGLTGFTIYRSRNGAAPSAYTTPTVSEISAANLPGVYALLIDEDTVLDAGHDVEEYCLHIAHASMQPVTRVIEIMRVKFSEGQSAIMANSAVDSDLERIGGAAVNTSTAQLGVNAVNIGGTAQTGGDLAARLPAALVGGKMDANVGSIETAQANKIADHTLRRTFANAAASADGDTKGFRSLLGAIAKLVNKWSIGGTTLTIYESDDLTTLGTQALTATPGADPITGIDTT